MPLEQGPPNNCVLLASSASLQVVPHPDATMLMRLLILAFTLALTIPSVAAQDLIGTEFVAVHPPIDLNEAHVQLDNLLGLVPSTASEASQTSIWVELGYVSAMEALFVGTSYLGSRRSRWGPAIAGGFDLFMAGAGLVAAPHRTSKIARIGHYLISVGFLGKSLYNFWGGQDHSTCTRFLTNFAGLNVLVFTGYFLDTLK